MFDFDEYDYSSGFGSDEDLEGLAEILHSLQYGMGSFGSSKVRGKNVCGLEKMCFNNEIL